ncbi:D-alanine aminotransferase [Marinithermofilum abyssi]|uniref:D-alanine aminotransferase n=1 Tax=Marinithermofilum abyssi TaxID=1571185 RepID=A0A8J2VEH1_9BACL|nr:D-amino-acid transaminase [Marinithermofilum abyssi]GGE10060.1 D-alanine aminotransferase [Marinithermofilum abyssi]
MILWHDTLIARERAQVDIEDRGYQFGDGIYEVIRVYGGKIFCLSEHLDRFERSAREIKLDLPYSLERLGSLLEDLVRQNQLTDGTVYLQASRGAAPRNHPFPEKAVPVIVAYTKEAPRPMSYLQDGIHTITQEDIRWLRCDIKSLNLLGAVLAKQAAVERGCQESILHRDGRVTEGSSTNVFIVKDGELRTHPANNLILHGITRAVVLELAQELAIPVKETPFFVEELFRADEIFVTSTTMEIAPVVSIDGRKTGSGHPGPVTRRLQEAFEKRI